MQILQNAFAEESLLLDLHAPDLGTILHKALDFACDRKAIPEEHRGAVEKALLSREEEFSTAIGHSVAIPHAYLDALDSPVVVFVRLAHPLNLGAPDGIPTRFLFVLIGPTGIAAQHLDTLTAIARLMSDDEFRYEAGVARNGHELTAALNRFLKRTAVPVAAEPAPIPEGLRYTGKLFGGVLADLRRRLPFYRSDFTDGLHSKSVSSTLFLFFACLAPAVTFGGIMAKLTGNHIGVVEMIIGSAICGVIYALFSGQPLIILGGTGPLLIFTMILYDLCEGNSLPFLETRAWIGIWTGVFLLILAATDSSCLLRFFTRFTDEIFAALISIIFIVSAVSALGQNFHKLGEATPHDKALLTLLLALGTLYVAGSLSRFRTSRYLVPWMREFLADFGPAIAIAAMTCIALMLPNIPLDTLPGTGSIEPTTERSWLVNPFATEKWVWFMSIGPAILVAVLVYVDQNITARLVNSPDHKLQKGEAYHYDLALMGVLIAACSLFGLPWLVAATVRSLNHVRSLATLEEAVTPGGETRERVIHVRENRLTGLTIHLLVGLSVFLLAYLKSIPMAVLYGLFLYMGIVSMKGNQFFERISLWAMDSNLYPSTHYNRKVPNWTIHKFTFLQLVCLAVLGAVEIGPPMLAILFPLFVVLLVPVRYFAGRYFSPAHLVALDAEEEPEEEETHWSV